LELLNPRLRGDDKKSPCNVFTQPSYDTGCLKIPSTPIFFRPTDPELMNKQTASARREHLILFTRFPEPGKVKTRLIAKLGPQGAAHVHKKMTEQVIRRIQPALQLQNLQMQVYYDGGSAQQMADWLGPNQTFSQQQGNDLGQRMALAFNRAFHQGASRTLLIGSDCPGIDVDTITIGLEKLHSHDLVLGPAADGGYYLIGLRAGENHYENLFDHIDWGTDQVLTQTVRRAKDSGLSCTMLKQLHDIDRPEDLVYFDHHTCS